MAVLLGCILCPQRTNGNNSLLVSQQWCVHESESIKECCLWVCSCFSCSAYHILFVSLVRFIRKEAGKHTAAVLWVVASRTCSKQHTTLLCSSQLAFSICLLLTSLRCIHIEVWTQLLLIYQKTDFHIIDNL